MNPKIDMDTHLTGSWLARPKRRGSELGKYPTCQEEGRVYVYLPDVEYSHPQDKGPLAQVEGWLPMLYQRQQKTVINKEARTDSQSMRMCLPKSGGGGYETPKVSPGTLS